MGRKKYLPFVLSLGMAAGLLFLTACGGGALPAVTPTPRPEATPPPAVSPRPVVPSPATPAVTVAPTPTQPSATKGIVAPVAPPPSTQDPLIAKGEEVFQRTAGGVGCQACHGRDARGAVGPDVRGATVTRVSSALSTVEQMAFIKLSPEEVQAVAAYLQFLATQP